MTRQHSLSARSASIVALVIVAALTLSCRAAAGAPKWDSRSVAESIAGRPFTPVIVNSNIGRGPTRLALALLQQDQTLVLEGEVTARLFKIDDDPEDHPDTSRLLGSYDMTARTVDTADHGVLHLSPPDRDEGAPRGARVNVALRAPAHEAVTLPAHDGALSTIFTTMVDFHEAGLWGADLQVITGDKTYKNLQLTFAVQEQTAEPSVGDAAPRTMQEISKDGSNLANLDSSSPPHPALHDMTVAEAIATGKPTLVAFVTPAFCQTRFCGPVLNSVVIPVQQRYAGRVNVIHIEPYDLPTARKGTLTKVAAADQWNLRAEPFLAVVDGKGIVTAKFEGIIDLDELRQALDATLAAG